MYIAISFFITLVAIYEVLTKKSLDKISFVIWAILTFLLCFRYGQGTDYFNYYAQFEAVDPQGSFFENTLYHGEPGWYALLLIARRMKMSFELFVGIISLLMMLLIRRGVERYSPYKSLSYFLLFPTYYMTYCNAALRQALVLSLFLGFGLQFLIQGKKDKYVLLVVLSSLLHSSSLILLCLLFSSVSFTKKNVRYLIPISALFILGLYLTFRSYISQYSFSSYLDNRYSIGGIIIRVIMTYIIIYLFKHRFISINYKTMEGMFFNMYMIGFVIFLAFSFTGTFAQRLTMPFKALEIFIIPLLIANRSNVSTLSNQKIKRVVLFLALLMNVELIKNIDSYIDQGEYRSDVTVLNYPYVNVFDKSAIYHYRTRFVTGD